MYLVLTAPFNISAHNKLNKVHHLLVRDKGNINKYKLVRYISYTL